MEICGILRIQNNLIETQMTLIGSDENGSVKIFHSRVIRVSIFLLQNFTPLADWPYYYSLQ